MKKLPFGYSDRGCCFTLAMLVMLAGCTPREEPVVLDSSPEQPQTQDVVDEEDVDVIKIVVTEPQQITTGETVQILVRVDRPPGAGEIRLRLEDLPQGIEMVGEQSLVRQQDRTHLLVLRATELAEGIVDAPVTIVATTEGYPDVRHVFWLTVTAAHHTLALGY